MVKKEFLKTYEPKCSAHKTCANFLDQVQKPGEGINDYHVRVQTAKKRLTDSKPATMAAVRLAGATSDQAKLEGMKGMAKFFKHQLLVTTSATRSKRPRKTLLLNPWSLLENLKPSSVIIDVPKRLPQ